MIPSIRPIRHRLLAGLALILTAAGQDAVAATRFEIASAAWHQNQFREAYDGLAIVREQPNGRRPVVDFMLGTSACRLGDVERDYGHRLLDWMLYAYSLSLESRQLVATEREVCARGARGVTVVARPADIRESRSAGMSGYGKSFYWASSSQPVSSYPMRRVRPMELEEFSARLVTRGDEPAALALAQSLVTGGRTLLYDDFLIIGTPGHSDEDLRKVGQTLSRFLRFLVTTYGMVSPDHYVRVHLVASPKELQELADRLHGLDVSRATIGYSFVEDASLVGYVPESAAGTLLHELFHLMVRSNFGDVPQWLDEGLASLYEVSGRRGDRYFGLENWRRKVLDSVWHVRPTLDELIRSEWFLYDDPSQARAFEADRMREGYHDRAEGARQAAMMAVARYFIMYLEQHDQLVGAYSAIRDRGLAELRGDARDHAVALVVDALGATSIDEVDRNFVRWYQAGARQSRKPSTEGGRPHVAIANVNVRTGPGTNHTRLMTIDAGTPVAVLGQEGSWARIELTDGTTAFVSIEFLDSIQSFDRLVPRE